MARTALIAGATGAASKRLVEMLLEDHDVISSVLKLRLHSFHDTVDTEEQVLAYLCRYREDKILP